MAKIISQILEVTTLHHFAQYFILSLFFLYIYPQIIRPYAMISKSGYQSLNLIMDRSSLTREQEICGLVLVALLMKLRKCGGTSNTMKSVHQVLLHLKLLSILLLNNVGNFRGLMLGMCVIYLTMMVFLPSPKYSGESRIKMMNTAAFKSKILTKTNTTRFSQEIVAFWVNWSHSCHFSEPILAKLSNQFIGVEFYKIDLDACPEMAKKYDIRVSMKSKQLPTLILFEGGEEIRRFPPFHPKDGSVMEVPFDRETIVTYFELGKPIVEASLHIDDDDNAEEIANFTTKRKYQKDGF